MMGSEMLAQADFSGLELGNSAQAQAGHRDHRRLCQALPLEIKAPQTPRAAQSSECCSLLAVAGGPP